MAEGGGDAAQVSAQPPLEEKILPELAEGHGSDEENMSNVRHLLVERMDPDFGLLDKLLQLRALAYPESGRIKSEKSIFDRNEKLLELIFNKMKHQTLLTALTETGQKHLCNLVRGNGEYRPEYETVWPLREREIEILDVNRFNLVDIIDPCDLITRMFSKGVINNRQQGYINNLPNNAEKAEALLDILRRGSEEYYYKTVSCLQESNQSNVAEILFHGGVLAQVDVSNDGETDQVNKEEDQLLETLENLLRNTTLPQYQRLRERLDLRIMRARKGKSIVFYIYCKTIEELLYLYELLTKGEFKIRIATVFDLLLSKRETAVLAVKWSEEEFTKFKTYFEGELQHVEKAVKQQQQSSHPPKQGEVVEEKREVVEERRGVEDAGSQKKSLEAEVSDEERKAVEAVGGDDDDDDDDDDSNESEPDDDDGEARAISARKEKLRFGIEEGLEVEADVSKLELTELTRMDIIAAIMRNTTDYLMEYMKPEGLIDKLHATECLTDDDTRYIKTLQPRTEKNDEILNVIDDEKKYYDLINCLRQTKQHLAADIVEKGGVVLKVKVTFKKVSLPDVEKRLVEIINTLHNKSIPKREEVIQFLSQLRKGSIEVLDAQHERGIILWIWCRSEEALSKVRSWYKSKKLNKLLLAFFDLLINRQMQLPEVIRTDIEDIQMEFAAWPPKLDPIHQLPVVEGVVCSVTTLPGKIFVLCQNPTEVLVFENKEYSKHSKRIPIKEISNPVDTVACHQAGCLYITDVTSLSVWKVMTDDGKVTQWLQNVDLPYTLSLTLNGEVVMVRRGQPSTLEVHSPDGKKLHDFKLPPKISLPNHAVETSAGTFFVSYGKENNFTGIFEIDKGGNTISYLDFSYLRIVYVPDEVNSILEPLCKEIQLGYPRYLALNKHDQLYVADFQNGGVMVLDSQLCLEQVVGREDVKQTLRLCCGEEDNQLVIVHGEKRLLSICEFSIDVSE